jgi:hypothetical protein
MRDLGTNFENEPVHSYNAISSFSGEEGEGSHLTTLAKTRSTCNHKPLARYLGAD